MKLFYIFLFFLFAITFNVYAQNVQVKNSGVKSDTIAKKILDNAYLRIYYNLDFKPDTSNLYRIEHAETLLQVGKKYTCFIDYNKFRLDSINDDAIKRGENSLSYMPALMNLGRKIKFKPNVVVNSEKDKITIQKPIVLTEVYQYNENKPKIDWKLLEKDTIILDYLCRQAECKYKGRKYLAWYSEKIKLPSGPYIFGGLPGLIFEIKDIQEHYVFKLNGIVQIKKNDPIYLWSGHNVIKTTREKVRKIHKNYCNNPIKALMNTGKKINIPSEYLNNPKTIPYNPIELE